MPHTNLNGSGTGFDLTGVGSSLRGYVPELDPAIKVHLEDLNAVLGKRIFKKEDWLRRIGTAVPSGASAKSKAAKSRGRTQTSGKYDPGLDSGKMELLLGLMPLRPKLIAADDWPKDSLAYHFKHTADSPKNLTLSNLIDATPELATLKYAVQEDIESNLYAMDFTPRAILDGYPAIRDYLIAYAFHVMSLKDENAVKNFILSNPAGVPKVAYYAIVSAARSYIAQEKLKIGGVDDEDSDVIKSVIDADLQLDADSFTSGLQAEIADFAFNTDQSVIIDAAIAQGLGPLPDGVRSSLIKYIKASPWINEANAVYFLPGYIEKIKQNQQVVDDTPAAAEQSDSDFDVTFLADDRSLLQISKSAVKCASQLYYGMILGDELEVFNTINYFTHKYLIRGSLTIEDSRLRQDLQSYVFSNRFTDLKSNKLVDRTRSAERAMFYRQVFNYGSGQVTEDVIVNQEFPKLWKVLMLESANYLERAQISPNPDSYVPRRNVMQAVEDLQYNLSTHCTGMSNVITPLIYAELDFVIRRIFMHREILRQVVPAGGTWWRVVETLFMAMKNERPKSTVIYNKAKIGQLIIASIADYDSAVFTRNQVFSDFVGKVQEFITTQSILQDALKHDLRRSGSSGDDESEESGETRHQQDAVANGAAGAPAALAGKSASGQEWDF